jgi:hypothetical protein
MINLNFNNRILGINGSILAFNVSILEFNDPVLEFILRISWLNLKIGDSVL